MTKRRSIKDYLQDILDTIAAIEQFTDNVDFEEFSHNTEKIFAVSRAFEIIGEAVKNVPDSIRAQNQNVPWRDIAGMRDKLIHGYFDTDVEVIWKAAIEEIPQLRRTVLKILKQLKQVEQ